MKLGFGLMRLPMSDENTIDIEQVKKMADAFIAAGGTYFDTAYPYHGGKSETAFREAVVKRYPRESFTVTDKLPMFSIKKAEEMQPIFDEQLARCGVEYFDYYWLHALGNDTYNLSEKIGAFDFIAKKKAEGKVKHIGFSFHDSAEVLDKILTNHPEMEFVQLQINYLDLEDGGVQSRKCYETAVRHGKPVIVMEPVKGGALANVPTEAEELMRSYEKDMSPASWAVRFAASYENVMMVLSGMSSMAQMEDNLGYMKDFKPLTDAEKEMILKCGDIIRNSISIKCTACKYCVEGCPKKIAIPDYFKIYNDLKRYGRNQESKAKSDYAALVSEHGKASDCIKCGKCEEHCPQHLTIREYLTNIASKLES